MEYLTITKKVCSQIISLTKGVWRFFNTEKTLQPKEIADQLEAAMEKSKKVMIDGTYAPNLYLVYLSPMDMVEMRPLIKSLRDQLKGYMTDKISKKGYRIITDKVEIEIKENLDQEKNQAYVDAIITDSGHGKENGFKEEAVAPAKDKLTRILEEEKMTKVVEDKKTRILDESKVKLEITSGEEAGKTFELTPGEYTFGRSTDANIVLKDKEESVSRQHFKLNVASGEKILSDLNSANGTYVNGNKVDESSISEGDEIKAGLVTLRVVDFQ